MMCLDAAITPDGWKRICKYRFQDVQDVKLHLLLQKTKELFNSSLLILSFSSCKELKKYVPDVLTV